MYGGLVVVLNANLRRVRQVATRQDNARDANINCQVDALARVQYTIWGEMHSKRRAATRQLQRQLRAASDVDRVSRCA
jgi:hypothetical protein